MRTRFTALLVLATLTGCVRAPVSQAPAALPFFSVTHVPPTAEPSPLGLEVRAGHVLALVPETWHAQLMPQTPYAREGFMASPRLDDWENGPATVRGTEAFWVDIGDLNIPSDYFYLAARGPALGDLSQNKSCQLLKRQVFVDNRPDFTGRTSSPGDYMASGSGVCVTGGRHVSWEYIVVAPGYGPIRRLGIPTSGLYVVIAASSGPGSRALLRKMIDGTTFGNTSIRQFIDAVRHVS